MRNRVVIAFAAILWLAAVTGSYYLTHKPFNLELAKNLALAGWRITIAGAILSVAGGLGGRILPRPGVPSTNSEGGTLFWRVVQTALGLGVLGIVILLVGLTVGFNRWFFGMLLLGLGVLLRRDVAEWWGSWRGLSLLWQSGGRLEKIIGLGCALLLSFTLFTALAPPLKFDALVYHLTLPQIYLAAGRIEYQSSIFWGMPQTMEMLFTWAISLGGMETGAVLAWGIGFLTLIGVVDFGCNMSPRVGWVAGAALLGGFTLAISLSWGYVDWLVMLFGLSTLILLDAWRTTDERQLLVLAGLCAGFATGTKYTAGVLALGGLFVVWAHSPRTAKIWLVNSLWFGLPALGGVLPWLLKNVLFTGNPVYPLVFSAGAMNAVRLAYYQLPAFGDWREAVFLPWQATMRGAEGGDTYGSSIGPLLLGFGLLGWVSWRVHQEDGKRLLSTALILTLTGLVFWAVSGRLTGLAIQSRLYMAVFPAVALLAGAGFEGLARLQIPGVRLKRVAGVVVLLVFGLNLLEVSVYSLKQGALQHLLGLSTEHDYLAANLGMTALTYPVMDDLPDTSRVLMLWETRSLYCTPRCIPDEIIDRWLSDRAEYGSTEAILASWRLAGYTHLLIHRTGADFFRHDPYYQPEDWQALDELLGSLPVKTDLNQIYTLYTLTP